MRMRRKEFPEKWLVDNKARISLLKVPQPTSVKIISKASVYIFKGKENAKVNMYQLAWGAILNVQ